MSKPRNGSRFSRRQVAGLLAVGLLTAAGAAAALLGREDLAFTALIAANGLGLVALLRSLRLQRGTARHTDVAAVAALVRENGEGVRRLERDLDALRERAEFTDQRLLATVERERLLAEERHREIMKALGDAAGNSTAAHLDETVRGAR
jgi:hypothetical protein